MTPPFDMQCAEAVRVLALKEVPGWKSVPAIHRFLWARGVKLRPPHFASWETNFFLRGCGAGIASGALRWLIIVTVGDGNMALFRAVLTAIFASVACGFTMAGRYKRQAEDHGLPSWDTLVAPAGAPALTQ